MDPGIPETTPEAAAEYLRLAVPLMSRHQVPATPQNYAVWYTYVSGENPELNTEIDGLITQQTAFSSSVCAELHSRFIAGQDVENLDRVRSGLDRILSEVGSSLSDAGNDAHAYAGTLGGFVEQAAGTNDLRDIQRLLNTLIDETRSMRSATSQMYDHFESKSREIEELQEQLQQERKRAITDPLTGLYNRLALLDKLGAAVAEQGDAPPASIIMLDIDHFKAINDGHGHLIGDRVIRFVAQVLQKNIKGNDTAARYGGEEFTVLLPATGPRGARAVAESIRAAVAAAQLVRADNKQPLGQITLSAGVAAHQPGEDIMELINRADQALYRAKREGRNRVCVAEDLHAVATSR